MERRHPGGGSCKPALLALAVCMAPQLAQGQTSSVSNSGTLSTPQSVAYITFALTATDTITFKTWGFGGGINVAGNAIQAGGFDPLITLYSGVAAANIYVDGSGNPVADADNLVNPPWSYVGNCPAAGTVQIGTNNDCGDVQMQVPLAAGTYTLMLTDANYEPGALYDNAAIAAPFVDFTGGSLQFQTCDPVAGVCINRNGNYALDIVSTKAILLGFSKCDINQDMNTNVSDVQLIINEGLGVTAPTNDLNGDGVVNVADVQIVINAALGLGCAGK